MRRRMMTALIKQVWEWSPRKARMFTGEHVQAALETLREHDWLPQELTPA